MQPNRGEQSALAVAIIAMMLAVFCVAIAVVAGALPPEVVEGVSSIGAVAPLVGSAVAFVLVLHRLIIIAGRRPFPQHYRRESVAFLSIMAIAVVLMVMFLVLHASNMGAAASAKRIPLARWPAFGNLAISGSLLSVCIATLAISMYARAVGPQEPALAANPRAGGPTSVRAICRAITSRLWAR